MDCTYDSWSAYLFGIFKTLEYGFTIAGLLKLLFPRETHLIQQMISLVWYYVCFEQSAD